MILTCPSCRTRYRTDGVHFNPNGRDVRCAKCGEVWFQRPPESDLQLEPEPVMEAVVESGGKDGSELFAPNSYLGMRQDAKSSRNVEHSRGFVIAKLATWSVPILFVAGAAWVLVQYRQPIVDLWPQWASFYSAFDMPVKTDGIAITDVAFRRETENGLPEISVTGKLVNRGNRDLPVPQIRVVLFDDAKRELYGWTFDPGVASLKPGAESPFVTRLSSPPPAARNLDVRFEQTGDEK